MFYTHRALNSMSKSGVTIVFILVLIQQYHRVSANVSNATINGIKKDNDTILSRTRRYLVFPEGSSFQVVFDLTYPSVAIQGNVFCFGHTAAMAWELPSTPIFLDKKKLNKESEEKQSETTTMEPIPEFSDDSADDDHDWQPPMVWDYSEGSDFHSGWQEDIHSNPYNDQYSLPNMDMDSIDNTRRFDPSLFWNRRRMRFARSTSGQKKISIKLPRNRTVARHIQRRSRRELYAKVEKLLTALSKDGKSCVLKAICQVKKLPATKGTMWEEIVKAIFKAQHDMYPDEDHYDRAANLSHDCDRMYPNCDGHVLSSLFKNKTKKYRQQD